MLLRLLLVFVSLSIFAAHTSAAPTRSHIVSLARRGEPGSSPSSPSSDLPASTRRELVEQDLDDVKIKDMLVRLKQDHFHCDLIKSPDSYINSSPSSSSSSAGPLEAQMMKRRADEQEFVLTIHGTKLYCVEEDEEVAAPLSHRRRVKSRRRRFAVAGSSS